MLNMPSHNTLEHNDYHFDYDLDDVIMELKAFMLADLPIPLDLYTELEEEGVDIDKLINQLEKEIQHGESEVYDSYWGC
jgi:hypothetical protein